MSTLYAGPAKAFINSVALFPEGENGAIDMQWREETKEVASGMHGHIAEQLINQEIDVTLTPFDNWGLLATLYPAFIGAKVGAAAAALVVSTRPHAAAVAAGTGLKVWSPDGRLYNPVLAAVIGHPSLHLGNGKALFGGARISCIGDPAKALGASSFLLNANAITESAASDPGGNQTMADFVRGAWTATWTGITGFSAFESEEEFTVENTVKYSALKVQGLTRAYKLDSAAFMVRCKPYGPTHTQLVGIVGAHTQGQRYGQADLVLSGPSSKTVTLKNAELRGAGFKFGGTTLGTGEVGFVNQMTFTTGAPNSLIEFSV